jgi:hypothetical protein
MRSVAGSGVASVPGIRRRRSAGIRTTQMFFDFRNQIDAAASERMAAPKPLEGKPRTMSRAVELHGSGGIL